MDDAMYLFCLARTACMPIISGTGVDGKNPLFLQRVQDITAVLSMVSLDEYCGSSAESRMQDMAWLGQRVWRHEEVIEQVMRYSPVLPVRFATIFHSWATLEKRLQHHHDAISEFLNQVAEKDEWAVKVLVERKKAKEEFRLGILGREEEYLRSLSPGARYLHTRRILGNEEKCLDDRLKVICKEVEMDLRRHSRNSRERRVLSGDVTGRDKEMLLNLAFLVPRINDDVFSARIRQANEDHAGLGLVFELSGPWPPYSFAPSLEAEPET
jgi:hypothetical protein